jgi:hypothetical protein
MLAVWLHHSMLSFLSAMQRLRDECIATHGEPQHKDYGGRNCRGSADSVLQQSADVECYSTCVTLAEVQCDTLQSITPFSQLEQRVLPEMFCASTACKHSCNHCQTWEQRIISAALINSNCLRLWYPWQPEAPDGAPWQLVNICAAHLSHAATYCALQARRMPTARP